MAAVPPPSTSHIEKTDVVICHAEVQRGRFGILTRFLEVLRLDGGVNWWKSAEKFHSYGRLVTDQFFPDEEYLQQCLDSPRVRRYLEISRCKKPVYVITGIKTVHGASAESRTNRGRGGKLDAGADLRIQMGGPMPVRLGVDVDLNQERSTGVSWGGSEPFVLAFRVKRVYVDEMTGEVRKQED